jgi:chlorobactene glucosyltransferase
LRLTALVIALIFWAIVLRRWRRQSMGTFSLVRPLPPRPAGGHSLVSIILPARNEAGCIEACVRSLLAQDYQPLEIVAVDDCSEDETGAILDRLAAADGRLRVIHGTPVPEGWMGKAHAVVQGYHAARGDWLLFTDADTEHAPWLLSAVMTRLRDSPASFATALGWQRHPSRGVHLINLAVATFVFLLTDLRSLEKPQSRASLVNGQYVIFTRESYEAIGTHAVVRQYSSTDLSLGYLAKLQGWMPLLLLAGEGLETTMYRSAREAFQGWSRSLVNAAWTALGKGLGTVALFGAMAGMVVLWLAPWVVIWRGSIEGDTIDVALGVLLLLAGLCLMRLRGRWWWALRAAAAMPAACVLLVAVGCSGLVRAWAKGGTVWKGRVVQTSQTLPPWHPRPPRPRKRIGIAD